jgi:hypothetical protein
MLERIKTDGNLSDADFALLVSKLETKTLKKGEHFLEIGKLNTSLGYIEKGLAMYYRVVDGEEIPVYFGIEGDWASYTRPKTMDRTDSGNNEAESTGRKPGRSQY